MIVSIHIVEIQLVRCFNCGGLCQLQNCNMIVSKLELLLSNKEGHLVVRCFDHEGLCQSLDCHIIWSCLCSGTLHVRIYVLVCESRSIVHGWGQG